MRFRFFRFENRFSALRRIAVAEAFTLMLLVLWAQPVSACPEANAAVHQGAAARAVAVVPITEEIGTMVAERCCECSILTESLRSAAPYGKQSLLPPDSGEVIRFPKSSRADLVGVLAARTEASNSAMGAARRPAYLLTSRLRQ